MHADTGHIACMTCREFRVLDSGDRYNERYPMIWEARRVNENVNKYRTHDVLCPNWWKKSHCFRARSYPRAAKCQSVWTFRPLKRAVWTFSPVEADGMKISPDCVAEAQLHACCFTRKHAMRHFPSVWTQIYIQYFKWKTKNVRIIFF